MRSFDLPLSKTVVAVNYKQLTPEQRYTIQTLLDAGHSQTQIAHYLGFHRSTICRELKRNASGKEGYVSAKAQKMRLARAKNRSAYKIKGELQRLINQMLAKKWSPEQIRARLLSEHQLAVSVEAIYLYIYRDQQKKGNLYKHLRRSRKKRRKRLKTNDKRGQILNRVDIADRPKIVEENSEFGHWEADTVIFAERRGCILTLVERKSKYLITALLPNREAETVQKAIIQRLKQCSLPVKTITYDNGKEFAGHMTVNKELKCESYFCKPYHSWERGLNENTNGLLRQYIPKSQTLSQTTWQDVRTATMAINNRPRKCLSFLSAREFIQHAFSLPCCA